MREADLPTQQPEAQEEARIPRPDAHPRRARRAQVPTVAGSLAPVGLIHRVRSRVTFARLARARPVRRGAVWIRRVESITGPPQVAYAIGRPVGNAVMRNRLRRRLREVVARHADQLHPGSAYLIGVRPELASATVATLESDVQACLEAAK